MIIGGLTGSDLQEQQCCGGYCRVCLDNRRHSVRLRLPAQSCRTSNAVPDWGRNWATFVGIILAISELEAIANMTG